MLFGGQALVACLFMVMVEGREIKAKPIHENKLRNAWKNLSRKPLPKIKALRVDDNDFNEVIDERRCFEDSQREIEEWGRILPTKGTDACVFNACKNEGADYVILVRENPFHAIDEIILHELSHIARGDL